MGWRNAEPGSHRLPRSCASPLRDNVMPDFRYRALTETGQVVSGKISAPNAAEVARRIDYLKLVPIDEIVEDTANHGSGSILRFAQRARPENVTIFTLDLALLLKAGARL